MIYIEVNFSVFCDQFHRMNRANNFTYEGKKALWRYLEEDESDISSVMPDLTDEARAWMKETLKGLKVEA